MTGALSHVRVLDATRVLAGPWSTQLLADMGAEVIKIERPKVGDETRAAGPPFLHDREENETKEAAYYLSTNRGKKSVTIDISRPEGQELIRKLALQCDIFVENYKVGTMKRYGLDYETLSRINPKIVYCSITGFGQTGPYKDRPGYDFIFQGMSGLMSITGERDDLPGGGPQKLGVAFSDLMTGMYTTVAILSALSHCQHSGKGQYIDLALLDVVVSTLANMNSNYLISGNVPKRMGNAHANLVPYQVFQTADGHIILAAGNDDQFRNLCRGSGCPGLADDPKYSTNPNRIRNRSELIPIIEKLMLQRRSHEWLTLLEKAKVACGPINNIAQALSNEQVLHREMVIDMPHPLADDLRQVGNPIKFSKTPVKYRAPPTLGQHTAEVLRGLGLDETALENLSASGTT